MKEKGPEVVRRFRGPFPCALGGSLAGADVGAQAGAEGDAARSLAEAAERLHTARARLAAARAPDQYAGVVRTAAEGLHHVGEARRALGLDPVAQGTGHTATSGPPDRAGRVGRKELLYGFDASY